MKKILFSILIFAYLIACSGGQEKPTVQEPTKDSIALDSVDYKIDKDNFEGFVAYDKSITGKRPGVLVVHEWWGLNDYPKTRAKQLADMGYVAFAVDLYGKGIVAKDHEEAGKLAGATSKDPKVLLKRISKGLELLKANPNVDTTKIAAIGYCFGGMSVLELALDGQDLKGGVVSFHGMLAPPSLKTGAKKIKSKLLVHHGADDHFMTKEVVDNFLNTMKDAKVSLEFVSHPGASHGFTVPNAGSHGLHGLGYNYAADKSSWESMKSFLKTNFQ